MQNQASPPTRLGATRLREELNQHGVPLEVGVQLGMSRCRAKPHFRPGSGRIQPASPNKFNSEWCRAEPSLSSDQARWGFKSEWLCAEPSVDAEFNSEWRCAEPSVGRTRSLVGEYVKQPCSFQISTMESSTRNGVVQSQASVGLEVLPLNM